MRPDREVLACARTFDVVTWLVVCVSPLGLQVGRGPAGQLDPDLQLAAPREHPSHDRDEADDADRIDGHAMTKHTGEATDLDIPRSPVTNDDRGHLDEPPF